MPGQECRGLMGDAVAQFQPRPQQRQLVEPNKLIVIVQRWIDRRLGALKLMDSLHQGPLLPIRQALTFWRTNGAS